MDDERRDPFAGMQSPASYAKTLQRKLRADARKADYHKSAILSVRLPPELLGRIKQRAEGDGKTVNAWLVKVVTAALDG